MAKEKLDKIAQSRGNVGETPEDRRNERRLQGKEATAYSIFVTNFVYILIFSILSQQVFNSLLYSFPVYNYLASALLSVVPLVAYVKGYIWSGYLALGTLGIRDDRLTNRTASDIT